MKVEVELPELPEGYEYTGKMIPDVGDLFVDCPPRGAVACVKSWKDFPPFYFHPVVRKKQLTYSDLKVDEYFRFADSDIPRQKGELAFPDYLPRPVVRIKWEDVK